MIRKIPPNKWLLNAMVNCIYYGISYDSMKAHIILAGLIAYDGNRSRMSRGMKINIKTLRNKIKLVEGYGYDVPEAKSGGYKKRKLSVEDTGRKKSHD